MTSLLCHSTPVTPLQHSNSITDDACCICYNANSEQQNDEIDTLIYCENCHISVHSACYGAPLIIDTSIQNWLCHTCQYKQCLNDKNNNTPIQCCLCSTSGGALKRTTDYQWCHITCALWVPECFFRLPDLRDTIDILQIPEKRYRDVCYICEQSSGCTVQCSTDGCNKTFHVTCGLHHDTYLDYKPSNNANVPDTIVSLCTVHSRKRNGKKKR